MEFTRWLGTHPDRGRLCGLFKRCAGFNWASWRARKALRDDDAVVLDLESIIDALAEIHCVPEAALEITKKPLFCIYISTLWDMR